MTDDELDEIRARLNSFIHTRADVAALLDEVDRLRAALSTAHATYSGEAR